VVTVNEDGYTQARELLAPYGEAATTGFHNVVVLHTTDPLVLLHHAQTELSRKMEFATAVSRIMPVEKKFSFQSPDEFEYKARQEIADWVPRLAGKHFHVRMHRRGFKQRMRSVDEEQFLDHYVMQELAKRGEDGSFTFDDPDVIVVVETVGNEAGMSLWDREQRRQYPLLKLD
jgi:tRNA(Ser,Leu) C12 N-acetylase TAN1